MKTLFKFLGELLYMWMMGVLFAFLAIAVYMSSTIGVEGTLSILERFPDAARRVFYFAGIWSVLTMTARMLSRSMQGKKPGRHPRVQRGAAALSVP